MDNFTLKNLHLGEIKIIRQSLNHIPIKGADASFLSNLQSKIDAELKSIQIRLNKEQNKKQKGLENVKNQVLNKSS
jgi:hypothetical protein